MPKEKGSKSRTPRTPGLSQSQSTWMSSRSGASIVGHSHSVIASVPAGKAITEPVLFQDDRRQAEPALKKAYLLRERWYIEGKIGGGAYGQIYKAKDRWIKNQPVAVKVELQTKKRDARRLVLETQLMKDMQSPTRVYMPDLYGAGAVIDLKLNFLVMQLLSRNLTDLRRLCSAGRFSVSTTFRVSRQVLMALRDLHQFGYLHRDLKPGNMALGIDDGNKNTVYVIDYGLVRRYKNRDGTLRTERSRVGFRGTLRYCALRVHNRVENSPGDDLWSWFYTMVELNLGALPWRQIADAVKVKHSKETSKPEIMCAQMPKVTISIAKYLQTLGYGHTPDYARIEGWISEALQSVGATNNDPYDWETEALN